MRKTNQLSGVAGQISSSFSLRLISDLTVPKQPGHDLKDPVRAIEGTS